MYDIIINRQNLLKFNILLTRIVDAARVDSILLINKSGRLITAQGEGSHFDKTSLSALVASTFASTNSIAKLIGQQEFTSLVQEGQDKHLYICLADDNSILACIFDKRTNAERVKQGINEHIKHLKEQLHSLYNTIQSNPDVNMDVGHT